MSYDSFDPSYTDDQYTADSPLPSTGSYVAPTDTGALSQYDQYGPSQDQSSYQLPSDFNQYIGDLQIQPSQSSPGQSYQTGQAQDQSSTAYDPKYANSSSSTDGQGVFSKILQGFGIQNKNGEVDYSDPKVLDKILKAVTIGGSIVNTLRGPQNKKSASELAAQFKSPFDTFQPSAQTAANNYFGGSYTPRTQLAASSMPSSIVSGQRYAGGGEVEGVGQPVAEPQGPLSFVKGSDTGQSDTVKANLSHGEYVFDADTVAALGDGNNEAGARLLDKWREELRRQKRSAPADQIPPKAKAPTHYLGKVK